MGCAWRLNESRDGCRTQLFATVLAALLRRRCSAEMRATFRQFLVADRSDDYPGEGSAFPTLPPNDAAQDGYECAKPTDQRCRAVHHRQTLGNSCDADVIRAIRSCDGGLESG